MTVEPAPELTPAAALARIVDAPAIVLLAAGTDGATVLAWDAAQAPVADWSALRDLELASPAPDGNAVASGWSRPVPGAHAVQLDYEFPAVAGRAWRLDRFVAWDAAGRATLHARDADGIARMRRDLVRAPRDLPPPRLAARLTPAWDGAGHRRRVDHLRALIAAGDIYQANLTLPFGATLRPQPHADAALAVQLIGGSPAPYAAFLRGAGDALISHSPERFLRLDRGTLTSSPIKGTRRRVPGRETEVRAELMASAKERAELAMIVDLVRNDLGRVATIGTVSVDAAAEILDLPYVHHLVARVRCATAAGATEAIRAAFPAGSITGCPKLRAMQVIAQSEAGARGAYCGTFGWIARGACDLAVAIRSVVVSGERVRLHAGGGITADSDADAEWDEARAKASAMAAALGATL